MNTLIWVLCCMSLLSPICGDINSAVVSEYDNVLSVDTLEYDGNIVVAVRTEPFFTRSSKEEFVDNVSNFLTQKFCINRENISVTFDVDAIYNIRHISSKEDIQKVYSEICKKNQKNY